MGKRVITLGLDGLEPSLVEGMLEQGRLPNLARLRQTGGYARLSTTMPAQTPVAWSSFAVGANPGVHGIFDFLHRDPATYRPDVSLFTYTQAGRFLPPRAVNRREGQAVWSLLAEAGVPATVLRHPATYPPETFRRGRILSGVGVPDLRGGFGTTTWFAEGNPDTSGGGEHVVAVEVDGSGIATAPLRGPRGPKGVDSEVTLRLHVDRGARTVRVEGPGAQVEVVEGRWSDWLPVRFRLGALQAARGIVRFHLASTEPLGLLCSPVNFDADVPLFAISHPWDYAAELKRAVGTFHTLGMAEEHGALNHGRITEEAYLDQCQDVFQERLAMMRYELDRFDEGFFYCLFDTPDRLQHMFWRFRDASHPANRGEPVPRDMARVIEDHYVACDDVVGEVMAHADPDTLVMVASDHGFTDFRRSFHLNAWLQQEGYLVLKAGVDPGGAAGDLLTHVDWGRTRAYGLGLAGMYLNLEGREAEGRVSPDDAPALWTEIAKRLTGLPDPGGGTTAVRRVLHRDHVYRGPHVDRAPDLLIYCAPGYRISAGSAMGSVASDIMEDNTARWSGDHVVDPLAVPGVLFANRKLDTPAPDITDLAPTILSALGVPAGEAMEGTPVTP